ncbi:plastocyanin/azurin family copper-binding protein [Pseudolabrys sp. FHR47]|uniref:cupredoxin domain-containing protein n=1 Tax=Pseudolabrys sp. FHR47 TaxID=2562284 RepID=UPI0010BE5305|nr:cupredoxin family protein [Pseudolabrys sp. FHR47]
MILPTLVLSLAILTGPVSAEPGAPGHSHAAFSAGKPGNPKKPARTVVITMKEGDGKMIFNHNHVEVKRGEQIKFVLENHGELEHEFVLATPKENDKHALLMQKFPDMEHDDPNAKRVATKKSGELLWQFTKAGTFEFACLIPGHREAGMHGKVVVK